MLSPLLASEIGLCLRRRVQAAPQLQVRPQVHRPVGVSLEAALYVPCTGLDILDALGEDFAQLPVHGSLAFPFHLVYRVIARNSSPREKTSSPLLELLSQGQDRPCLKGVH